MCSKLIGFQAGPGMTKTLVLKGKLRPKLIKIGSLKRKRLEHDKKLNWKVEIYILKG